MESFNGRLRDECLNEHVFALLTEAHRLIEAWQDDDSRVRPHGNLGGRTPEEFAGCSARAKDRAKAAALLGDSAPSARSTKAPTRGRRRTDPSHPRQEGGEHVTAPGELWLEISGNLASLLRVSGAGRAKAPAAVAVGALEV
ncbi:transposase, partial [Roseomonas stagni]|nr:transposase [Falsiroseomonas algicola]